MTHANDELWCAFSEEVGEQLDNLDMELSKGTAACDIHQVFRDFHTIKSSCAMLDMGSMKDLAHVSEDYLDLLRKGALKLTEQAIDTLLSAVEKLKQQLALASASHQNPEAATDIISAIKKLIKQQTVTQSVLSSQPEPMPASALSDRQLELAPLARLSRSALLDLAQAQQLTPTLKNTLITFGNMAQLLDLPLLQTLCRDIVLAFRPAAEETAQITLLHHQADLIERIRDMENEYHLDFGARLAEQNFRTSSEKTFLQLILALADVFSTLERLELAAWLHDHHEIVENQLGRLSLFASLFGLPELRNLFTYTTQVIRSARRGHFQPSVGFAALLRQAIDHPYADLLQAVEDTAARELLFAQLLKAQEQLKQATAIVDVDVETIASEVSASSDLVQRRICEIDIDMGSESALVENLVQWLSRHGRVINSTSAFEGSEGLHIRFTVEFDMAVEQVKNQLLLIDSEESCFYIHEKSARQQVLQASLSHQPLKTTWDMPPLQASTLRINSQAVDGLVTQVGEVVMARNMIGNIVNRDKYDIVLRKCRHILELEKNQMASPQQLEELKSGVKELMAIREELLVVDTRLHAAITQVQQKVLDLREMPVAMVFNRLPNLVRKISQAAGKNIQLKMTGDHACVDKGMMEILLKTLAAVLQHMIVDGPHTSELSVDAALRGNYLNLVITCNSALVESVALAELKTWLDRIGGQLLVGSKQKNCTAITLDFPRSVAMQNVLLVRSGTSVSAIPERNIVEIRQFKGHAANSLQGRASIAWRKEIIPLAILDEWIHKAEHQCADFHRDNGNLLIVNSGQQHVGIVVDEIIGLRDSFVPEIHAALSSVSHINGTTVLGDGSVVFVLNVDYLLQSLSLNLHELFRSAARHDSSNQHSLYKYGVA